ncbi:MAG: FtsL-like putative cell division protein, partial [Candidatus Delongbacteria bacterium]|nr:FtsL-like putative cell division protein [Candidatus Delongbacteria bacterium]
QGVLDGSLLTRENVIKQLPFIIFLTLLGLIYITNRYHAEKVFVLTEETRKEIRELRSEKISVQSELMRKSRQQEVLKMLKQQGSELKYAQEPPVKIVYELDQ